MYFGCDIHNCPTTIAVVVNHLRWSLCLLLPFADNIAQPSQGIVHAISKNHTNSAAIFLNVSAFFLNSNADTEDLATSFSIINAAASASLWVWNSA